MSLLLPKAINTQHKFKASYAKYDLLIIDEWLLRPLPEAEAYDLLEIIEACSKKGALILCTQYDTDEWYYRIDCDRAEDEDSAVAEGILDRIIHNKYSIEVSDDNCFSLQKLHCFFGKSHRVHHDEFPVHHVGFFTTSMPFLGYLSIVP